MESDSDIRYKKLGHEMGETSSTWLQKNIKNMNEFGFSSMN